MCTARNILLPTARPLQDQNYKAAQVNGFMISQNLQFVDSEVHNEPCYLTLRREKDSTGL